jgi:hypothetical protein
MALALAWRQEFGKDVVVDLVGLHFFELSFVFWGSHSLAHLFYNYTFLRP